MSCDQKIIAADWEPLPLQRRPDVGGMIRGRSVENQNLKPAREALDLAPVVIWPGLLCSVMKQLCQNHD